MRDQKKLECFFSCLKVCSPVILIMAFIEKQCCYCKIKTNKETKN